ncbi:MAG: WYL domain-containing protein [Actinomycetota bacterium]|nr:MAG: WYL domain-containing protein [Actinomycetota bacterium]
MHPLERLVNLVALLLEAERPLTFEDIRERMHEAYDQTDLDTAKRMFERDKGICRDLGIPIEVVPDPWEVEHAYTIRPERYYLPEIAFTPEEISALFVAAHAGREGSPAEEAVRKLLSGAEGGILAGVHGFAIATDDASDAVLTQAAEAVAGERRVAFTYRTARGEEGRREVDAYGLAVRGSSWYLVGRDLARGEIRSFRLSRVTSDIEDLGEGSAPPPGFRASDHVHVGPWGPGEARERARIALSPRVAWWATKGIAEAETVAVRDDGWVEVEVPIAPDLALAAWVLSFGPDAVVLGPEELRAEVVRRLEAVLAEL